MDIRAGHNAVAIDFSHWIPPEKRPLPCGLFVTEDELQESIDAARANFHPQPEEVTRMDPWDYFMHDVKEASAIRMGRYIPTRVIHDERAIEETKDITRIMPTAPISKSDYLFDLVTDRGDFHGDRGFFFQSEVRNLSPHIIDKTRVSESCDTTPSSSQTADSAMLKPKISFSQESSGMDNTDLESHDDIKQLKQRGFWKAENDVNWDIRNGLSHNNIMSGLSHVVDTNYQFKRPTPAWMRHLYKTIEGLAEKDENGRLIIPCWATDQEWIAAFKRANRLIEDQYKVKDFFAIRDAPDDRPLTNIETSFTDNGYIRLSNLQVCEQSDKEFNEAIELDDNLTAEEFSMLREAYGL